MTERRGTKALELWCRRMVEGYPGVKIDNMTTSWRDGLAFCAIIHHFRPELIDFAKLTKGDIYRNNDLAFTVAEKHLGIPALLEPGDMVEYEVPDRLSILTYLAQFYRAFATTQGSSPSRIVPKRPAATSERGIVSPASTSPPTKMISRNGGAPRRDPCARCGLPVFIAERLNVGKCLYHRTCFRCARCNGQLSLVNYYETDSSQFCCETCPDEVSEDLTSKEPEPVQTKSLSDEEKSASLEKKQALDTYSSIFENALEAADDTTLKKDSTLSSQFVSARSHFLTAQVEDLSGSDTEMELPELPKTKPPDLKPRTEELKKDDNGKNSDVLCVTKNNSVNTDSDLKSDVNRTKNSDQLQAANRSNSYRDKNVITKDNSVRSRLKFYEPSVEEKNVNDKTCPVNISTSSPISESGNMLTTITNLCLSPIALSPNTANTKNNLKTDENLNTEPLKKSHTSPSLIDLAGKKAGAELTRQSIEDLSKAHQPKFIDDKKNVSALDDKLVDVGVIESAPVIHNVESHSTTVDDHVSDQLVEKDNCEVLGDGDLEQDEKPTRSDDTLEDLSTSNSVIVIDADTSTDNSRKHVSQSGDEVIIAEDSIPVIEISDETKSVIEISDDKTEDYPEDLNPFGDDSTEDDPPAVLQKSLNPFDEDEEEETVEKPTPAVRKNLPSSTEKKVKSLNPFDEDSDEEDQIKKEVPKTNEKKKIAVLKLQNENDTPDTLFVKRISISPSQVQYSKPGKKVLAAPRISLNPVWSDVDDDGDEDEKTKMPVPTPRKLKSSTLEQNTPERKLKDQENPSAFGSSSSLSSANSGGQSVRKKKPAPRPPILSPDKQESTHSSLTSSPSTSAQHSPRLSASKNRKTKRAPPPPTLRPKDLSVTTEELSFIEQQNLSRKDWDKEKDIKDEENRNRQSLILANPIDDSPNSRPSQGIYLPNKSTYGKWKKKKGPAPSRPILQKRTIKQLPVLEIKKELDVIELQQQGLEKQGVRLEQIIRERCEGPQVDPNEVEPIDVDDLMLQLFEVVNEKNELCRRQAELMYLRRQHRLEEEYADVEYQIRCLMNQTEANKTDTDKAREEELIMRLVEIVEKRNEIVECLEIDRLREHDEDTSISQSMNTYAAKRDEIPAAVSEEDSDKKDKKKKKKLKLKLIKKTDLDKDIDESESGSQSSNKEKKKKKFTLF